MARELEKLSARTVATLKKPGRHSDGGGLYLTIANDGQTLRRRWVFLFRWKDNGNAKSRLVEMGLGAANAVTLAKARELAAECRADLAAGINPRDKRDAEREAQKGIPTFGQVADALIEAKEGGWRNAKHRQQWRNTLATYAAALRSKPVDEITTEDVLAALQPIWQAKPETASRVRGRIEAILDAARVRGHIPPNAANPARWRGHLDKLLPRPGKLSRGHHPAMPFAEVPAFMERLRARKGVASLLLEFIILTAARTGEARDARWSEIDLEAKVWTVPASRMKGHREHRVPLCDRAVEIAETLAKVKVSECVFPGNKHGKPLSNMAPDMLLRRMKADAYTTHGFRSSFRDWCGECTAFPREVAEAALAHAIGDKTESAYRRGDALAKRRTLMGAWAEYLSCPRRARDNVIALPGRADSR
jgi:integrase